MGAISVVVSTEKVRFRLPTGRAAAVARKTPGGCGHGRIPRGYLRSHGGLQPPWRQPRGENSVNLSLPLRGSIWIGVELRNHLFTPGLFPGRFRFYTHILFLLALSWYKMLPVERRWKNTEIRSRPSWLPARPWRSSYTYMYCRILHTYIYCLIYLHILPCSGFLVTLLS